MHTVGYCTFLSVPYLIQELPTGPQKSEDQIYSILPVGILNNRSETSSPSPAISNDMEYAGSGVAGVRSWMDHTSSAREAQYEVPTHSTTLGAAAMTMVPDWSLGGDWSDANARERRHTLPGPLLPSSSSSSIPIATTSSSPPSSSSVPFPATTPPSRPDSRRAESKLRNVLSVIGESRQPSGDSEDYEPTERASSPPPTPSANGGDEDADSDNSSEDEDRDDRTIGYRSESKLSSLNGI